MIWTRQSQHTLTSDAGYKIARYKVADNIYYRPSIGGEFISRPFSNLDEAKAACDEHERSNQ